MPLFSFASAQGPLPREILSRLREEIDPGPGATSLLELPFSVPAFEEIRAAAEQDLRDLLALPEDYSVLFLQGGASAMFALVPMNLLRQGEAADYIETGLWSRRAARAAQPWGVVRVAASGEGRSLPPRTQWRLSRDAVYCHLTTTETAEGLQYFSFPETAGVPIVADMTADFLTRPLQLAPFGLIYASAQKNLGIAGLTIVVIHRALVDRADGIAPAPLDFARQAEARSKVNTPPVLAIAVAGKVLRWLRENGGLAAAKERGERKAKPLYAVIDDDGFYDAPAPERDRSRVSLRFHLPEPRLEEVFLREAEAQGLVHLRGHPEIGGLRASLYNGVTQEAAEALATFMRDFRQRRG
ncbi:MAG TPA: 3-phosphoserine/phosphohydroxythreonine transaminase [Rhodoblastus sp.]|nr:3-phosphoserine/phosphohydroxythreonine transaminase [Rhodoblastus sp.]